MTAQPDYTQMAQSMLQMWQDHWKNFSAAMHQTAPQGAPQPTASHVNAAPETNFTATKEKSAEKSKENGGANPSAGTIEGMEQWQRFMASWAQTSSRVAEESPVAEKQEPKQEPKYEPARAPEPRHEPSIGTAFAARSTASAAPATSSHEQRDVLFVELTRRVEFLHERVVKLESELEKLKRRSF